MEKMNSVQPLFPHLPERLAGLEELAENLWWSWNPGARMLFKTLDRQAWKESGHNPDKMLRELPRELLEKAGVDTDYIRRYDEVMDVFHNYMQQKKVSPDRPCCAGPQVCRGLLFRRIRFASLLTLLCRRIGLFSGRLSKRMQRLMLPAGGGGVYVSGGLFPPTDPRWTGGRRISSSPSTARPPPFPK